VNIKPKSGKKDQIKELLDCALVGNLEEAVDRVVADPKMDWTDDLTDFLAIGLEGKVTAEALKKVEAEFTREAQGTAFREEIEACRKSPDRTAIRRHGPLAKRNLWLDEDGVLRLQTRVFQDSDWPLDTAVPAVLPRHHPFTQLVIRDAHRQVEHQGANSTFAKTRERFYIPQGKNVVKKICRNCKYCRERKPVPLKPPVAHLHQSRLRVNLPPWYETGMDHFGPFSITKTQKKWGLIFICLTTRAVHLEDVDGLGATVLPSFGSIHKSSWKTEDIEK